MMPLSFHGADDLYWLGLRPAAFLGDWRSIQSDLISPDGLPFTANIGSADDTGLGIERVSRDQDWRIDSKLVVSDPRLNAGDHRTRFGDAGQACGVRHVRGRNDRNPVYRSHGAGRNVTRWIGDPHRTGEAVQSARHARGRNGPATVGAHGRLGDGRACTSAPDQGNARFGRARQALPVGDRPARQSVRKRVRPLGLGIAAFWDPDASKPRRFRSGL